MLFRSVGCCALKPHPESDCYELAKMAVSPDADNKMEAHKSARMIKNHLSNVCNIGFGAAMQGMYLFGVCYCGYGILKTALLSVLLLL